MWSKFACLPHFEEDFKGRVFVDILNEPDSQGQGWQPKESKAGELDRVAAWPCDPGAGTRGAQAARARGGSPGKQGR